MDCDQTKTLPYRRSHFATQLPADYLYSPSHFWVARQGEDLWRVGLTKFATRMLGDMVDFGFELDAESPVACGQIIGWVEGFKAISDVYCVVEGRFSGLNQQLKETIALINKNPYGSGWLYNAHGHPDEKCVDVYAYKAILDQTIDRILEKQKDDQTK